MAMSKEQIVEMVVGTRVLALEQTVVDLIESLEARHGRLSPLDASYAMLARKLARKIDRDAGMATAAIGKELRDTLEKLVPTEEPTDDFWNHFTSSVPTTVRNASPDGATESRP
jgi:hypothetical protein